MFLLSLKLVFALPGWKRSTARKNYFLLEEREGELRKKLEAEQATIQLKRQAVDQMPFRRKVARAPNIVKAVLRGWDM